MSKKKHKQHEIQRLNRKVSYLESQVKLRDVLDVLLYKDEGIKAAGQLLKSLAFEEDKEGNIYEFAPETLEGGFKKMSLDEIPEAILEELASNGFEYQEYANEMLKQVCDSLYYSEGFGLWVCWYGDMWNDGSYTMYFYLEDSELCMVNYDATELYSKEGWMAL